MHSVEHQTSVLLADAWKGPACLPSFLAQYAIVRWCLFFVHAALLKGLIVTGILERGLGPLPLGYWNLISSSRAPQLPTEIWAMILEEALRPIYSLEYRHEPRRFHLFVRTHQYKYRPYTRNRALELTFMHLRLVCRRWNALLSFKGELWLRQCRTRTAKGNGARGSKQRFNFNGLNDSLVSTSTWITEKEFHNHVTDRELQSLKLVGIDHGDARVERDIIRHTLLAKSDAMPFLQTIVLFRFQGCRRIFKGIRKQFSGIKVVSLCSGEIIQGILALDQADTLILHAIATDIKKWKFPSLLYYSVGAADPNTIGTYDPSEVPGPTSQLLCLDISFHVQLVADANFWFTHESLRSLSVEEPGFHFEADAPENHPIEHISLSSAYYPHYLGPWGAYVKYETHEALRRMPNLKHFSITCLPKDLKFSFNEETATGCLQPWWYSLFVESVARRSGEGMIWLDENGEEVRKRWHWRVRTIKPWESAVATVIYTTWIVNLLWTIYSWELLSRSSTRASMVVTPIMWVLYHSWAIYDHYVA